MEYSFSVYIVLLMCLGFQFGSLSLQASASIVTCQTPSGVGTCNKTSSVCSSDPPVPCPDSGIGGSYKDDIRGNSHVEKCDSGRGGFEKCRGDSSRLTSITLSNVSAQLHPLDFTHFSINVSWALASSDDYGGYEVRLTQTLQNHEADTIRCLCISSPNVHNFNMRFIEYRSHLHFDMRVSVLPYPVSPTTPEGVVTKEVNFVRPRTCGDIPIPETVCEMGHYGLHQNLTVRSKVCNNTKEMEIGWASPILPAGTLTPPVYYVYLHQHGNSTPEYIFIVNNATSIVIRNLNIFTNYSVQLQLYGHCSEATSHYRGCGSLSSSRVEELFTDSEPTPDPTTDPLNATASSMQAGVVANLPLLSLVVIPPVFIIVVVILLLYLLVWGHVDRKRDPYPPACKDSYRAHQVFVFYCSTTPQKEVTYIQQHIVSPLLDYFEVVTLNNFISGDLPAWMERTVQMSKSVLLVSNQEFSSQWSKIDQEEGQDPAMNCLSYIISAAVSAHALEKFGIVTMKESDKENCIPFNSYLGNFPVFVLSKTKSKNKQEVEKIYRLVTHMPSFQHFSNSNTPTTEGPAHVAVCYTEEK